MFQNIVNREQTFGFEGKLYSHKHSFTYALVLLANGSVNPTFGKAFTYADNPNSSAETPSQLTPAAAKIGGTSGFAGLLVYPEEHISYNSLEATASIPANSIGSLLNFGEVVVKPKNSVAVGFVGAYDTTNGDIYGYPQGSSDAAGYAAGAIKIVNNSAGTTFTVGTQTYTLVASLEGASNAANNVVAGASVQETAANLASAIIGEVEGEGVVFGTGTQPNTSASAYANGDSLVVVALASGTEGNSISLASSQSANTVTSMANGSANALPEGQKLIPHSKFVIVDSASGGLAVLQIGD